MNKAIIAGSTGLIGTSVARYLSSIGIEVLCLGRKNLDNKQAAQYFGENSVYLQMPMHNLDLLPEISTSIGWTLSENTVFYNFSWCGINRLTDGDFRNQISNAVWAAEAVKIAKKMNCTKFINSGSIEETYIENYMNGPRSSYYSSDQTNYGLAKLAARDLCKMVAYIEKIDYIHTRLSVPLASDLSKNSYINLTLRKILNKEKYELPKSERLYDLVLLEDVSLAYSLIGQKGKNKADYFIGTGKAATLKEHFEIFSQLNYERKNNNFKANYNLDNVFFNVKSITQDTGFVATRGLHDLIFKAQKQ